MSSIELRNDIFYHNSPMFILCSLKKRFAPNDNENVRFLNDKPFNTSNVVRILLGYLILNMLYEPIKIDKASDCEFVIINVLYSMTIE